MENLATLLIGFVAAAGIVTVSGVFLTHAGDELGDRLGLGGTWVGLVVLSSVTSLPELVSSIGGAVWQGQPDLACGNVFGSNCFNVFIIALLDLYYRGGALSYQFGVLPTFSAGLGVAMTSLAGIAILCSQTSLFPSSPLSDGWWSGLIVAGYLGCMFLILRFERKTYKPENDPKDDELPVEAKIVGEATLKPVLQRLGLASLVVVVGGLCMVYLADELAEFPFPFGKLGHTFVGTLGLALATSLPELVVGVTALRMGKFELAVGNVFGSNIFNILVLAVCQIVYALFHSSDFYGSIAVPNLFSAFLAVLLAAVAIAGLMYRGKKTFLGLGWDTGTIMIVFVSGMYLLFLMGR
jgi:cation:H+ antiporter